MPSASRSTTESCWAVPTRARTGLRSASSASSLRQAEHALADDVALDLARSRGDRVLAGGQDPVEPAWRVGNHLAALVHEPVHAEQLARRLGDARSQLGAENLEDRALGPRWLAAKLARQAPQACQAHRLTVDGELGQPLAHEGIVPRGVAIARQPPRDGDEALHLSDGIARARRVALVHQSG